MSEDIENSSDNPPEDKSHLIQKNWIHSAITGSPIALFSLSLEGIVLTSIGESLNRGSDEHPVVGKSIFDLFPRNQILRKGFERAKKGEEVTSLLETPGMVFLTRFAPERGSNGEIRGVVGFALDMTERMRLVDKLSSSENQLRSVEAALDRRTSTINLLEEIAIASNESEDIESAIHFTIRRLLDYTGWLCGHALVQNPENPEEFVSMGIWEGADFSQLHDFRSQSSSMVFTSGEDLPGRVLKSKSPQLIPDLSKDAGFLRLENANLAGIRASFAFPVMVEDEVVAILEFFSTHAIEPTVDFLQAVAHTGNQLGRVVERQRSKEALRRSETLFRKIFDVAVFGIELVDLEGRLLAYNPAILKIFGYSDQEIRLNALHQNDYPVNVVAGSPEFRRMVNGELEFYTLERLYIHREGGLIWARVIVSLVRGEDGKAQYAIGMVEDITEKKQFDAEMSELNRRLIEGGEAERRHLAQDLHDGPIQDLYGISYAMKSFENTLPKELDLSMLIEAQDTLIRVIQSLRGTMGNLLPPTLAPFGLEKAIRSHAQQYQEAHIDMDVELDLMPDGQILSEEVRLALYRIYQICITNVIRHAQATRVKISFAFDAEQITLKVEDNGKGFSMPPRWIILARSGHLGLASAAERAQAIGGSLKVITAPGKGTQVTVRVPRGEEMPPG